jgi:hypothetical protein
MPKLNHLSLGLSLNMPEYPWSCSERLSPAFALIVGNRAPRAALAENEA